MRTSYLRAALLNYGTSLLASVLSLGNVLIIARVSSNWQGIMVGIILVLAVALDAYRSRGKTT